MTLPASIVIPTRDRPEYLRRALASIAPQAQACGCEVLVIDDSQTKTARVAAEDALARYLAHPEPLGANAARNTGVQSSTGKLLVFVDDDVIACEGWLPTLLLAGEDHPQIDVFAGRIQPLLEGRPPRSCGREGPPITSLDLGPADLETRFAWSANMAVRRTALDRVGLFDASLHGQGEEQEWQERLQATGGRTLYVAGAEVIHRRAPRDARLSALMRMSYARGSQSRGFDALRDEAPSIAHEIATLAGCAGHVVRYRCPNGLAMVAHSAGRLRRALRDRAWSAHMRRHGDHGKATRASAAPPGDDFLSGESGKVAGLDRARREIADRAADAADLLSGRRLRLARAARGLPLRKVLALGVTRERHKALAEATIAELLRSRHEVDVQTIEPGHRGKFENLNELLGHHSAAGHHWLVVFDDDIELPRGFLDRFLFLAERFALDLAQPAHRCASHAAWRVTRRQPGNVARETRFVEVGPLTAFASSTFATLLPFPPLKMGWGLDVHWAAIAQQRGWRCGVIDAIAINHRAAPAAQAYSRQQTIAEARAFLAERPYLPAREAQRTLVVHRRW